MDYKEKYEQALERARMINNGEDVDVEAGTTTCEYIFPELKESEDETIRKELIQYIKNWKANIQGKARPYLWSSDIEECNKLLAWLEKQGEQKPIEWSADDKNKLLIIEQILNCADLLISSRELTEIKSWLKSLKQRIGG